MGFIGAAHVDALKRLPGVDVVAIVNHSGAAEKAAELDVPNAFSDYREMIETCKPDCIHICTPNSSHREIALFAMERGIHVVCEKPVARDAGEAREMLACAERNGVIHAINLHNRFYPAMHQLRSMVQHGELGKILMVHGVYLQDCFLYDTDFNWRMISRNSGHTRVMADIGSHWIDLAEYLTGLRVTEVLAETQCAYPTRRRNGPEGMEEVSIDTEDSALILLRFEGGAMGSAVVSQMVAGKKNQTTINLAGTAKAAWWDSEQISDLHLGYRNEPNRLLTKDPSLMLPESAHTSVYPGGHVEGFPDAFRQNFAAIYDAIRGNKRDCRFATFYDGVHQMEILDALCQSARDATWVRI